MGLTEFCALLRDSRQFDDLEIRILRGMFSLENRNKVQLTANDVAEEAGISVTNAYKYLYSLQKKGLIESSEGKNKVFWLSRSSNPFPRILSFVSKDYLRLKEVFSRLENEYEDMLKLKGKMIWLGDKVYEEYKEGFIEKASLLMDISNQEILISTQKFFDDIVLLEAVKRAVERGVKIKIITSELHPDTLNNLKKIGIEMRLGRMFPYLILADGKHGLTVDENEKGIWFLNCKTDFREKFDQFWERAHAI